MNSPFEVSVIICTYNPRPDYLTRVLAALRAQSLPLDRWELLVIDNASVPPLEGRVDLAWHPHSRIVAEPRQGTGPARWRGIVESKSKSPLMIFCDDDTVLSPRYLEIALEIGREWPRLGVWGGQNFPEYETPPEPWAEEFMPLLALRQVDRDVWSNVWDLYETLPHGAGMCLRRSVGDAYLERVARSPEWLSLGRTGGDLQGCEDGLIALCALYLGLGSGLFKDLQLTHLIPAVRVTEAYLLKLLKALSVSDVLLRHLHGRPLPDPGARSDQILRWYQYLRASPRQKRFGRARREGLTAGFARVRELKAARPDRS